MLILIPNKYLTTLISREKYNIIFLVPKMLFLLIPLNLQDVQQKLLRKQ